MLRFIAALSIVLPLASGQTIPAVDAKALDGRRIVFPSPGDPKPALLLLGFSHKSSGDLEAWNNLCTKRYWSDARLHYYELVDLQGLPFFVKPMVLHGMGKVIKGEEKSHFVPIYKDEKVWKPLAEYAQPEPQYLLLVDSGGSVLWRDHGPASDQKCQGLEAAIAKLVGAPQ